jgi:hypothetical protein
MFLDLLVAKEFIGDFSLALMCSLKNVKSGPWASKELVA